VLWKKILLVAGDGREASDRKGSDHEAEGWRALRNIILMGWDWIGMFWVIVGGGN
jgi:hypothetical protein